MTSTRDVVENETVIRLWADPPEPSACAALGISQRYGRVLAQQGRIPTIKIGKRLMVPTAWVRKVLNEDHDGSDAA